MDNQTERHWQTNLDASEITLLTANLPTMPTPGDVCTDVDSTGVVRTWRAVKIVAGSTGARWAYWHAWKDHSTGANGIGAHPQHHVIADKIFNGDAAHFVGMLGVPYVQMPGVYNSGGAGGVVAWVLISPKATAPVQEYAQREPVRERYERSKEVYDVETKETKQI